MKRAPALVLPALVLLVMLTALGVHATEEQEPSGDDVNSASPGSAAVERYLAEGCSSCDPADGLDVALGPAIFRDGAVEVTYHTEGRDDGMELIFALVDGASDAAAVRALMRADRSYGTARLAAPADLNPARATVVALLRSGGDGRTLAADRREITTEPATLRGRVVTEIPAGTDDAGSSGGVAGVTGVEGVEGVRVLVCSDFVCVPARSGTDGTFAVTGIPAGAYRVRIGTTEGREIARVSLSSGETRELAEPIVVTDP